MWRKYIRYAHNMGKGATIRTGIENSCSQIVVIHDADLEYLNYSNKKGNRESYILY